ncbi:uncharacterized protein TNCV_1086461 [Trichonephila clavipes]|nr:uncharacterized protein TNCV_1086461 [Trichonephila clavipes]
MNNPDEKDKTHLESKLDTLKSLRIKLSDIRGEYYEVVADDCDLEPLESEILDLEDDCEDIQVRIKNILSNIDLKNNSVTSCENSFKNIKLPDIQLPRFNGSYHKWFNFKEQFVSLIDSNNSLNDSQKLYYLKSTLTGIAKDVITIVLLIKWLYAKVRGIVLIVLSVTIHLCVRNFERKVDCQRSPGRETLPNMKPRITTPTLNVNSECFQPKQTVESFENGGEFAGHSKVIQLCS